MLIIYICLFFLGASVASFINATIYRIDNEYKYPDIITKNSHCEMCKKQLTWYELIPIIGYLLTKGRCPKCSKTINPYYPISEIFLGISFLIFYLNNLPWYFWIILIFFFILSYYDIKYMSVPKSVVHILLGFCFLIFLLFKLEIYNLIAPSIVGLLLLVMNLFKKSFGFGDILVLFGIGILFSYQQFLVFFWIGILVALLYSLGLVVVKKVKLKKTKVSMIPFFSISFVIASIYGEQIFSYILKFLQM